MVRLRLIRPGDRLNPVGPELGAQGIGILAFVGDQVLERPGRGQDIAGGTDVADIAGRCAFK